MQNQISFLKKRKSMENKLFFLRRNTCFRVLLMDVLDAKLILKNKKKKIPDSTASIRNRIPPPPFLHHIVRIYFLERKMRKNPYAHRKEVKTVVGGLFCRKQRTLLKRPRLRL